MDEIIPTTRPHTTVILAMSADGKIADMMRSPARFGSDADIIHLERQIAQADAVLFGNGTLAAYGTVLRVSSSQLLLEREKNGKPPQPVQIVCSASGKINPTLKFFEQPVPKWLLTTFLGGQPWKRLPDHFDQVIVVDDSHGVITWSEALQQLRDRDIQRLAVLGGGQLVASLIAHHAIDEFHLTVCPLILGGTTSPTPVDGEGFLSRFAPHLQLLSVQQVDDEVFLHYRVRSPH